MYKKEKIVAIVQARIGSTRLPGKVLISISGKPILWHVVNRLKYSKFIDAIVVATTTDKKDDVIVEFCRQNGIYFYRGNEDDVLDRYYQTAKKYRADIIVRVTSDCPLIDPEVTCRIIKYYLKNKLDYVSNVINRTYPRGLDTEVFSFKILKRIWREAKESYYREHVTPYIYEHPGKFRLANIEYSENFSCMRWTVDEKNDLEFVKAVYKRLYRKGKIFLMKEILNLLKKEPHLAEINKGVKQKALKCRGNMR